MGQVPSQGLPGSTATTTVRDLPPMLETGIHSQRLRGTMTRKKGGEEGRREVGREKGRREKRNL